MPLWLWVASTQNIVASSNLLLFDHLHGQFHLNVTGKDRPEEENVPSEGVNWLDLN